MPNYKVEINGLKSGGEVFMGASRRSTNSSLSILSLICFSTPVQQVF
jgi:hypothetical protein